MVSAEICNQNTNRCKQKKKSYPTKQHQAAQVKPVDLSQAPE